MSIMIAMMIRTAQTKLTYAPVFVIFLAENDGNDGMNYSSRLESGDHVTKADRGFGESSDHQFFHRSSY